MSDRLTVHVGAMKVRDDDVLCSAVSGLTGSLLDHLEN